MSIPYFQCPVCGGPSAFDRLADRTVYCLDASPTGGVCGFMGSLPDSEPDPLPTYVTYPPGTPEHAQYALRLREELALFAAREDPYSTP